MLKQAPDVGWPLLLFGLILPLYLLDIILLLMASWREDPVFWTNAGGYPLWLRDFVRGGFYPLVALQALFLFNLSFGCALLDRLWREAQLLLAALVVLGWLGWVLSLYLAWNNNLKNWLEDRPIHSHRLED